MINSVQSSSAKGGTVSLVTGQPWVRRYNGPANNEDQAFAIATDPSGNIIVGGYSVGVGSSYDFLTIKYSPSGTALWTNRYDGPSHGSDQIKSIAVDGAGGIYVTGDSEGITTIKYAADGTPVWTNTYTSTASFMFLGGLAVDNNGNAYVEVVDSDSNAFITIKYAANGIPSWTNFFKTTATSQESASGIAVDAAGNIYVTGSSFDSASSCLTVKFASDGSMLWANHFIINGSGGSGGSGTQVIVDPQQNVLVAVDLHSIYGNFYAAVKYSNAGTLLWTNIVTAVSYAGGGVPVIRADPAGNVFLIGGTPGATTADYTTIKYSSAGIPLWTNRFVDLNAGAQEFDGAGTDNTGNLYCVIASGSPNGSANFNYVTVKYSATGTAAWTNRYNGPASSSDLTRAMTVDRAGGVYVTGTSSSGGTSFSALDWATVKYADNIRYVPPSNFIGEDTITFTGVNSLGNSATGAVTVVVTQGPDVVVTPASYATSSGNVGLNTIIRSTNAPRTYQMQFTTNALGGLPVGARITALRFRVNTNTTANFPDIATTWSDYEVRLAQAANPIASMSTTFAANLLNPVLVKDGPLTLAANTFSIGDNPNPFGTLMTLDTPYVYQGGDLVMQFTHTGSDSTNNAFLDGANSSAPGYGTSFRAISANSFGAATGIAASVTIVGIEFSPAVTQAVTLNGTQLVISGAGGLTGDFFRLLTSTNLGLPPAQWTPLATNQFIAGGGFGYTNVIQPAEPKRYFRVSIP